MTHRLQPDRSLTPVPPLPEGEGYGMPSLRESCVERWQVALRNNREAVMQSAPL